MRKTSSGFCNPHNLPTKTCPVCGLQFSWRKKWARSWAEVRYCGERCRRQAAARRSGAAELRQREGDAGTLD